MIHNLSIFSAESTKHHGVKDARLFERNRRAQNSVHARPLEFLRQIIPVSILLYWTVQN